MLADPREQMAPYSLLVKAKSKTLSPQQPQRARSVGTAAMSKGRRGARSRFEVDLDECRPWSPEKNGLDYDHMIPHS